MKFVLRSMVLLLLVTVGFTSAFAQSSNDEGSQSLEKTLNQLSNKAAQAYLGPIGSGFGANLNTGWTTRAPKAELWGVDIQLGVVAMGAMLGDGTKTFSFNGDYTFTAEQAQQMTQNIPNAQARNEVMAKLTKESFQVGFSGPTVVGKKDDHIMINFAGKSFQTNYGSYTVAPRQIDLGVGGVLDNVPLLPLGAPQLTIGTIYGTQVAFRYLPAVKISEDLGESKYFGFGIQHNIGQWIPVPMPVNLSVGYFTQNLKVGTILESKATEFGLYASRTFGPGALNVTPYAGFSLQSSKMTVNYTYEYSVMVNGVEQQQTDKISFDLDGENSTKLTLGLAFKLAFLNLNVDYNLAKYSTVGAGVGFIF
ncbi:MAG TPA: DUF6588 family protein [Ignavibacteriales bacterium]|nr:DUF6588 family protein [Ignavibacteriales bacterium]